MSPMSRSDARKREIQDRINTMNEHLELAQMGAWPHPPRRSVRPMSPMTNSSARKRHENTTPKEKPMVTIATPPQVIDDLHAIRTEVTTATSVLAEIRDLLDERLPSLDNSERPLSAELSTEGFTEPDDDPDEALAAAMWDDHSTVPFSDAHVSVRADYIRKARSALKHIADWRADEVERLLAARHDLIVRAETAELMRDEWKAKFERTDNLLSRTRDERDKAEAERDEALARCERLSVLAEKGERHAALRADIEEARDLFGPGTLGRTRYQGFLDLDDERGQS